MKYLKNNKKLLWFIFGLGIILIICGIALAILYFCHEVLDEKYVIERVTSYESKDVALKNGEVVVTKDIEYMSNGVYRISYTSRFKNTKNINLFEENSPFSITDIIGDGYVLKSDKIYLNGNEIKLQGNTTAYGEYEITYKNNTFDISYPSYRVKNNSVIEIYVKLAGRELGKKYNVSKDTYYSFTPSDTNSFYSKKAAQSYVVDGSSYIILKEK